jgi:uncharacterized spore protein YtfJ
VHADPTIEEPVMNPAELIPGVRDALTVRRVFGDPYERDGVTVIPAAVVRGAAAGGSGRPEGRQQGERGGFGLAARPAGAYVVKNGTVSWQPAVDVDRIVALGVLGWVVVAWTLGRAVRRR